MTASDTAAHTAAAVTGLASFFMLDGVTYARGAELGFSGIDFYFAGRGGVLGDTDADVVSAALVFFNPESVRTAWDNSRNVMSRADAAAAFAACGQAWGESHLPDGLDAGRLGELAGRVVAGAAHAGAPIFAGWRKLPVPNAPKAAALHHMNGLRELRFAFHGAAVVASGLKMSEAVWHRSPHLAPLFGWPEGPDAGRVDVVRSVWEDAEEATNRAMATVFEVLDEAEQAEFTDLATAAHKATSG